MRLLLYSFQPYIPHNRNRRNADLFSTTRDCAPKPILHNTAHGAASEFGKGEESGDGCSIYLNSLTGSIVRQQHRQQPQQHSHCALRRGCAHRHSPLPVQAHSQRHASATLHGDSDRVDQVCSNHIRVPPRAVIARRMGRRSWKKMTRMRTKTRTRTRTTTSCYCCWMTRETKKKRRRGTRTLDTMAALRLLSFALTTYASVHSIVYP